MTWERHVRPFQIGIKAIYDFKQIVRFDHRQQPCFYHTLSLTTKPAIFSNVLGEHLTIEKH